MENGGVARPATDEPGLELGGAPAPAGLTHYYLSQVHPLWPGNRCRLLRDGVEAFPEMLRTIHSARRRIRLEVYMFIDDGIGQLFGRALAEAAERGVHVTVLYDAVGSWTTSRSFFRGLKARGVDIRPFNPFSFAQGFRRFIKRDHRKLLIVDGEVAYVGGVNIAAQWAPKGEGEGWRDDVLRIEGPVVFELERRFCATWRLQVKKRLRELRKHKRMLPRGNVSLGVLSSRASIHRAYVRAIDRARESVFIAAGYFLPDRKILHALRAAAERGVDVALILAGKSDHPWLKYASRRLYERLLSWGVRIYEWDQAVLHAKTAVIDGTWGTLGSFNLDRFSLRFNHEVNVVFVDKNVARTLEDSFRQDCQQCRPIYADAWLRRPFWKKALERICFLFRKVL